MANRHADDAIPLFDTHQHLIYPDQFRYSWTDGIPALAGQRFELEGYLAMSRQAGIRKAIFMETAPDAGAAIAEHEFVRDLADRPDSIIGGIVAGATPEMPEAEFARSLDRLKSNPHVVGIRRILHVEADAFSESQTFVDNVNRLASYDFTFDLCVLARQLPFGRRLVERCPAVQFILDHCGIPDLASGDRDSWQKEINLIAKQPNVVCKISGLPTYAKPGSANQENLAPYVDHCVEQFGFDRVVWGGDWPVVNINSGLKAWVEFTRLHFAGESEENCRKLFYENAERIYGVAIDG